MKLPFSRVQIKLPWGIDPHHQIFGVGVDWSLFILPTLLSFLGIVFIFSVTYSQKPFLMISQIIYFIIGLAIAILLTFFDYRNLRGLAPILYGILIVLLIAVLFLGSHAFGAARWIDLKIFQLQPSEIGKVIILLFLARIFAEAKDFNYKKILLIIGAVLVPMILILMQPDFGTAMVFFVTLLILLFFSNIKKIILLAVIAGLILAAPVGWHFLKTYQKERIYTFINPSNDPYGSGYNVAQAKITVGSGGLWGKGIGKGSQIQLNFLPVAHTDFIFASAAEAIGFVGSTALILLLIFLVTRMINVARKSKDLFGYYFALGWGLILLFQIFVNVGMNMGIMPVTGIPLPFVSSGGTSMFTNMAAIGILQSIYLRHRKISF